MMEGYRAAPARRPSGGGNRGKGGVGASGRARPTGTRRVHPSYGPPRSTRPSSGRSTGTRASQPAYRPRKSGTIRRQPVQRKARPILPIPSADSIADLFNEIAGFKRESGQLGAQAGLQRNELGAARELYLKQLADTFSQQRTSTLEDFASRGLADSGIANEAVARLQNVYAGQQGEYETGYTNQLAEIMRALQGSQGDIQAKRAAAERRYQQLRAQRTAGLKAAGMG
jgi:hypothetical protein